MNAQAAEIAELEARLAVLKGAPRVVDMRKAERAPLERKELSVKVNAYGSYVDEDGKTRTLGLETICQKDVPHTDALYDFLQAIASSEKNPEERFYEVIQAEVEGKLAYLLVSNTTKR